MSMARRCGWWAMAEDRLILLVEDECPDRHDARRYVRRARAVPEPAQATTNEEALAAIASQPVAGALVDINLGDEKGVLIRRRWQAEFPCLHLGQRRRFTRRMRTASSTAKPFRIAEIEAVLDGFFTE